MDKKSICAAYQSLLRQAYPRVVVLPNDNEWNPYRDEMYDAFFVPDSAAGEEYYENWRKDGGWNDQIDQLGLPIIVLSPIYDSQVRDHHAHRFPEVFGTKSSASAKSKKSKPALKSPKPRAVRNASAVVKN